jgi:hypothetical protein
VLTLLTTSTIFHLLPLSLLALFIFVPCSHYWPLALAAVTTKLHRLPTAGWSECSTCHQNEVCDSCGSCHCNDIALPCSGVLRRRVNHLLAAVSRRLLYGLEGWDHRPSGQGEPKDGPLYAQARHLRGKADKHKYIVTPLCNDMMTSSQEATAQPAAPATAGLLHHLVLCQQEQPRRLPVVDSSEWMVIRPRRDQRPPEDGNQNPAILPPTPPSDKPIPGGVIVLVVQRTLYNQQQGGRDS